MSKPKNNRRLKKLRRQLKRSRQRCFKLDKILDKKSGDQND